MTATLVRPEAAIASPEVKATIAKLAEVTRMYGYDVSAEFNPLSFVKDFMTGHACRIEKVDSFEPEIDAVLAELVDLCAKLEIAVHVEFKPSPDFDSKAFTRRATVFSCWVSPCPPNPACFVSC